MLKAIKNEFICMYWDAKIWLTEKCNLLRNPFIFPMLSAMKYFNLDKWYGKHILRWELEYDFGEPSSHSPSRYYHFHRKNGSVVRPSDY